jgi:hypothetical protein
MEITQIRIVPFDLVTIVKITGFTFEILELIPNISANFRVVIYSEQTPKNVVTIMLEGDDYKQWSNDDSYLFNYIAKKLGYTLA